MKLFIVSDIHGCYDIFKKELDNVKFDERNPNHLLIICGDLFDRGNQSKEVYSFIKRLTDMNKAIMIKGNHETFIEEFFEHKHERVIFNCLHNGFDKTIKSLFNLDCQDYKEAEVDLLDDTIYHWIQSLPYYYETTHYIFVHAGIDTSIPDWKDSSIKTLIWDPNFYHKKVLNTNKKVIFGHTRVNQIRKKLNMDETNFSFFDYYNDKKGIDTNVIQSNEIKILILEDELIGKEICHDR